VNRLCLLGSCAAAAASLAAPASSAQPASLQAAAPCAEAELAGEVAGVSPLDGVADRNALAGAAAPPATNADLGIDQTGVVKAALASHHAKVAAGIVTSGRSAITSVAVRVNDLQLAIYQTAATTTVTVRQ
jgi:hypothetical protein